MYAIRSYYEIYVRVSDLAQDDLLKVIFSKLSSWEQAADYLMTVIEQLARRLAIAVENEADPALEAEYLYQVYLAIQRLQATLREHHPAQISLALFFRILLQP